MSDDDEVKLLTEADPDPAPEPAPPGKKRQPGWENVLPHRMKKGETRNPGGYNGAPWRNMMKNVALQKVVDPIGADARCRDKITDHIEDCACKTKKLIPLFKLMVKSLYMQAIKGNVGAAQYIIDQQAGRAHQSVQVEQIGAGAGAPMVYVQLPDDGSAAELDAEEPDDEGGVTEEGEPAEAPADPDGEE